MIFPFLRIFYFAWLRFYDTLPLCKRPLCNSEFSHFLVLRDARLRFATAWLLRMKKMVQKKGLHGEGADPSKMGMRVSNHEGQLRAKVSVKIQPESEKSDEVGSKP